MGKGFGINKKAQESRERKAAQKEVKRQEEQKLKDEKEAKEWEKGAKTKSSKQLEDEQRRAEKERQRAEKERLLAIENAELAKIKPIRPSREVSSVKESIQSLKPRPNISRAHEGLTSGSISKEQNEEIPSYTASNVDDAIFLLQATKMSSTDGKLSPNLDRHPERRVKAAYTAFEAREMARMKEEFPTLRISQLKERIRKSWTKAPENPFNQAYIAYNATKSQESLKSTKNIESDLEKLRFHPN